MAGSLHTEWANLGGMECYLARPSGTGPWPGVIVLMEIFGVNSHIREVTERIAAEGYVAIAPNYYHRTTKNLELGYSEQDVEEGRRHKDATTREGLLTDVRTCLAFLKDREDVSPKDQFATIGFCFGGHVAYIAATLPEIAATASFYGAGIAVMSPGGGKPTLEYTPEIKGEILCLFGELDPLIPHSQTIDIKRALEAAGVRHEVVRYPEASHGFFCNQRADFNPFAAKDAWERVTRLFESRLKTGVASR